MPSNTSAASATLISSLPYSITVDPDNAAQHLWWKYVATADDVAIGLFAWADDAGAYRPKLHVWKGDTAGTINDDTPLAGFEAQRKPCVLPTFEGETYWFQVKDANATEPLGASLVFSVLPAPAARMRRGDYFIADDTGGDDDYENWFPASVTSPATGDVTRIVRFPATEQADQLPTGEILTANWNSTDSNHLSLFAKTVTTRIADIPSIRGDSIRGQGTLGVFYVLDHVSGIVYTVSRSGVVGGRTWMPTGAFVGIAANADGTVLYYTTTSSAGSPVKRWDLVNDIAMSDLPGSAVTGYGVSGDLLVMADDTLIVFYGGGSPADYFARRYSADGATVLNTYSFGSQAPGRTNIGADRLSFGSFAHIADAASRFTRYDLSGTILEQYEQYQCNAGFFQFATPIADPPRFGHSQSCPLIILQQDETARRVVDDSVPCCEAECGCPPSPISSPTGSPSSAPIPTSAGPVLPPANTIPQTGAPTPLDPSYWDRLCAGAGTVPTASDPVDAESWIRV